MATKSKKQATEAAPVVNPQADHGLAEIVKAGANGIMVPKTTADALVAQGYVETAETSLDAMGNILTRATPQGINAMSTIEQAAAPAKVKQVFTIDDGIPIPEGRSGGGARPETYPFDALQVGQSFFVAATADRENPARSLASTVTSANNRYATPDASGAMRTNRKGKTVPVMTFTRLFTIKSVEGGARVWRTQ